MTVDELVALVDSLAELPYGLEAVDQRAHALQTAAQAIAAGADDELVVAAALHDVGRAPAVARRYAGLPHEIAGARFCEKLFSARVAWIVGAHVPAKRYLCATDPGYHDLLSPASVRSLEDQGGPLGGVGLEAFAAHPWAAGAAAVRRWDDAAKDPEAPTPTADALAPYFARCLR